MKWWRIISGGLIFVASFLFVSAVRADTTYTVQFGDTLWRIARHYNMTPGDIAAVNPQITNLNLIYGGDILIIPTNVPPVDPNAGQGGISPYIIRAGDTLYSIGRRNNTTVTAILNVNPQIKNPHWIYVGDSLTLPGSSGDVGGRPTEEQPAARPTDGTYIVKPGDGLISIAQTFNTDVEALLDLNPHITNEHLIFVGDVLIMPGGQGSLEPIANTGLEVGGETKTLAHGQRMTEIGMRWVKFEVGWQPGKNAADVVPLVRQGRAANFKVLLTITGARDYPTPGSLNYAAYTDFVRAVAGLGADSPDAIEIWHEQNIDLSWPVGEISAANYVRFMLAPTYNAIKAVNSNIMVISGGPSATGVHNWRYAWADDYYIREMAAAGAARYADCIGVHYNAGATAPNALMGHFGGSHYSWYFLPMISLYYDAFAQTRPLCFTQIGYLSPQSFPSVSGEFGWSAATKVDQQAAWLSEAVILAQAENRPVRLMIVYNVDYTDYNVLGDPDAGYAIFRPDGTCPACDRLSSVIPRG